LDSWQPEQTDFWQWHSAIGTKQLVQVGWPTVGRRLRTTEPGVEAGSSRPDPPIDGGPLPRELSGLLIGHSRFITASPAALAIQE
jgi:hypothetical protein